jgi:hypothetical protein
VLLGQALQFVVIDALVVFAHAVGNHVVGLARKIELMAVGQVAAVRQFSPMMVSPGESTAA